MLYEKLKHWCASFFFHSPTVIFKIVYKFELVAIGSPECYFKLRI